MLFVRSNKLKERVEAAVETANRAASIAQQKVGYCVTSEKKFPPIFKNFFGKKNLVCKFLNVLDWKKMRSQPEWPPRRCSCVAILGVIAFSG